MASEPTHSERCRSKPTAWRPAPSRFPGGGPLRAGDDRSRSRWATMSRLLLAMTRTASSLITAKRDHNYRFFGVSHPGAAAGHVELRELVLVWVGMVVTHHVSSRF